MTTTETMTGLFQTRLTQRYNIQHAFVGAGMGFVSLAELTAAVSEAGGMGTIGAGIEPPTGVSMLIAQTAVLTSKPFGIDFGVVDVPDPANPGQMMPGTTDAHIAAAVASPANLRYVLFHFDLPTQAWVDQLHAAGKDVWCQVPSLEQARQAIALGVDVIVAQGVEAGGHARGTTPLHELLWNIRQEAGDTLVLAAGGITTSIDVVLALLHGADGVWVGSRLVASVESHAHPDYKQRLVDLECDGPAECLLSRLDPEGIRDTYAGRIFGPELPGEKYRTIRNRVVEEWAGREEDIVYAPTPPAEQIGTTVLFPTTLATVAPPGATAYAMLKFSAIVPTRETTGDFEEMGLPAGTGAHRITSIKTVSEIINEMMGRAWDRVSGLLSGDVGPLV